MNDNKELFTKLHMYALIAMGAVVSLYFFFKILFG